jgi:UDP-N-acetylmuramoyl-tripeptide--D-alanyl-D-alanine ligase
MALNAHPSEITIVFAGDTSLGETYLQAPRHQRVLDRLKSRPETFFEQLTPLFCGSDHFVVNLETVLSDEPLDQIHPDKMYCYPDSVARTIEFLKAVGVDAVGLGNNHAMDFGSAGLRSTETALAAAGIRKFGAGNDRADAERPLILGDVYVVGGYRLNTRFRNFGIYADDEHPGVNMFRLSPANRIARAIVDIRSDHPRAFIIAAPHWGLNYGAPTTRMRVANDAFLSAGANLVLGHGTHNLQTCAFLNGRTTVFSLGNFVFNSPGRYAKLNASPFSAIVRLTLQRHGKEWRDHLRLYPIHSDNRATGFRPRPVNEVEAKDVFAYLSTQEPRLFEPWYALGHDERGWFIERRGVPRPSVH